MNRARPVDHPLGNDLRHDHDRPEVYRNRGFPRFNFDLKKRFQNRNGRVIDQEINVPSLLGHPSSVGRVPKVGDDRLAADLFLKRFEVCFRPADSHDLSIETAEHHGNFPADALFRRPLPAPGGS